MNSIVTPDLPSLRADIDRVFALQGPKALRLRESTKTERLEKIKRLKAAVLANRDAIIAAGQADFGKPAAEVELTEILPVIAEANDAIRRLGSWMKSKRVWPSRLTVGTRAFVQYEPKGRVLIISPWNYPVNLSLGPLVSALAAGNTVILKPSEMTPALSAVIARIVTEAFAEDEVAVFEGEAPVSQALLELPFDHIFFTGSPTVGRIVMTAAARHLASVTLELGGKCPTIIDETADLAAAAQITLWAKFTNNGQTCIAPDHVFVHKNVKDAFITRCLETLNKAYGENDQRISSPCLARVVNERHTARIKGLLDDALAHGARVITGGQVNLEQRYVAPTLLEGIGDEAKIMQEEIFGPLLPIIVYDDLNAVIARINAEPKPLALYVWSRNEASVQKVLLQTSSGGACVNHSVVQFLHGNLPFGGVNNSGIGSAHGHHGFLAFSHERAVVRNWVLLVKMFFPPYSNFTRKLIDVFMKTA